MYDDDSNVDQLIREHDDSCMPLPSIDSQPHLLISKVRKHYMDYVVKLLTANYETNGRLVNKNIYLPSAILRCAKIMETKAVQDCMVVQLYRQSFLPVIKELKNDTIKGKLNKRLYECLHRPPENDKKVQTSNIDECFCHNSIKIRKYSKDRETKQFDEKYDSLQTVCDTTTENVEHVDVAATQVSSGQDSRHLRDSDNCDELTSQLEKLFQTDPNDDDLFDAVFSETIDSMSCDNVYRLPNGTCDSSVDHNTSSAIDAAASHTQSLDARLESLTEAWNSNENQPCVHKPQADKPKKIKSSKWLCEEYYWRSKLHNLLYQIGDRNRKKLVKVKQIMVELFGEDSDDEGVVSPPEETPEFIISCKERIAPWVVETLTPFYVSGRIKGKPLFKQLAKHIIRLILQCTRYPEKHDVHSFVDDFLKSHQTITCEADFLQFKIQNI